MASRYFLVLCALALIAGIAAGPVEEVELENVEDDEDVERFWQGLAIWAAEEGAAWLSKEFIKVKVECFPDVYKKCEINPIKYPKKYYKCADNYFQANAKRCLDK